MTNPSSSSSTSGKTEDSFTAMACSRRPASTASTPSRSPSTSPGTATANATFETGSPFRQRTPSDQIGRRAPAGRGRGLRDFRARPPTPRDGLPRRRDARARRAAAAPPGLPPRTRPHADRRAQVSFIRDAFDPSFNWIIAMMEWLCQEWGDRGGCLLKGVVRPSDAVKAVDRGFDAVSWGVESRRAAAGDGAGDGRRPLQRSRRGGGGWAAAKAAEGRRAREGREGGERGSRGSGDRGDDGVDDRSSRLSRGFARLVVRGESRFRGGCRRGAVGGGESAKTGLPVEVIADGGVQRGTDILKLLALGADGVAVGKPTCTACARAARPECIKRWTCYGWSWSAMGLLGVGTVGELRERMARGEALVRRRDASVRDFPDGGARGRGYGGVSSECRRGNRGVRGADDSDVSMAISSTNPRECIIAVLSDFIPLKRNM